MTWVRRVEHPHQRQHVCGLPYTESGEVGFGSRWRCDECGTLYEAKFVWYLVCCWEGYPAWRPVEGPAWWQRHQPLARYLANPPK